jgi:serine/threonine protein kinase
MKTLGARVSTHSSPKSNNDASSGLGNYEILEEIGRSRTGVIFRARQRHFRRIVVVKRVLVITGIPRKRSPNFRCETQTGASPDHPNILL